MSMFIARYLLPIEVLYGFVPLNRVSYSQPFRSVLSKAPGSEPDPLGGRTSHRLASLVIRPCLGKPKHVIFHSTSLDTAGCYHTGHPCRSLKLIDSDVDELDWCSMYSQDMPHNEAPWNLWLRPLDALGSWGDKRSDFSRVQLRLDIGEHNAPQVQRIA